MYNANHIPQHTARGTPCESKNAPILCVVIPCFNEEKVLPITAPAFLAKIDTLASLGKIAKESMILFVDDGSSDTTWEIIQTLARQDRRFTGISLSRNRGHQNALLAGLMEAKDFCDITVSIDCDGQDDLNAIDEMIDAYANGYEIVYGVRSNRDTDTFFKRCTAESFYKLMKNMGADVVFNHADYRLVSSRVLCEFAKFTETNIFLRGLFPLVGFRHTSVFYGRKKRIAGTSHYPLRKMLALAFDGITSLSIKPLRMIAALGCIISAVSFAAIVWSVVMVIIGNAIPGWASTICVICFIGGVQLISLGVMGEYIGKIYMEVKHRPRYIIEKRTGSDEQT